MGRPSKKKAKAAIPGSAGIISTIAKRMGCAWQTARDYINEDPDLLQMYNDETEGVLDMAESVVFKSAQAGNTQDAKWLLSKKGKARGYGDKVDIEHTGANGGPIETKANVSIDVGKLTTEQIAQLIAIAESAVTED